MSRSDKNKDFHDKPFDEGTLSKLNLFEEYTKAWLPTFVMSKYEPEILILDLFAGPGYSGTNQEGSPIRILKQVNNQIGNIFQKGKKVFILFNEYDKEKVQKLRFAYNSFIEQHSDFQRAVEIGNIAVKVTNMDASKLFPKVKNKFLNKYPVLIFLDQFGIKFLSKEYLEPLVTAKKVDFMFYISSSYFNRFGNTQEFKNIINIDLIKAKKQPYKYIHQSILEQLKAKLPLNNKAKLYPFTIKKGANVYGVIFGASHKRGIEKFLNAAWAMNSLNGSANFDINDDAHKGMPDLFGDVRLTTKMKFENDLANAILAKQIKTNCDAFDFAIERGHLPSQAAEVIRTMKKNKQIYYDARSPMVTYENACKSGGKIITYTVL